MHGKSGPSRSRRNVPFTRREFLTRTAAVAGAASLATTNLEHVLASASVSAAAPEPRVVQVRSDGVVGTSGVHEELLFDLLELLIARTTHQEDAAAAWRCLLRPDDIVALKFNRSGAEGLGTSDPMMRALVRSLGRAGFKPSRIVAVEVSPAIRSETATRAPASGWGVQRHHFGSGEDRLAEWLDEVTAIVNVPFLKSHNIARMTCCLKNLSHAVVKHPAQFHGNGCSPYIADIVALPQVCKKLRVNIVNGLRVVFDKGPEAIDDFIWDAGILLGGLDPVAVDLIGLQILDRVRSSLALTRISDDDGPPQYLIEAAKRGLGTASLHEVTIERLKL